MIPNEIVDLPSRGEIYFRARRDDDNVPSKRWTVWCAKTPDLGLCAVDVDWSLDCWFEYGTSLDEALGKLKREVLH